jgi:uncharacterized phage-like protein YoqJ
MTVMVTGHRQVLPPNHVGKPWPDTNPSVKYHHSLVQARFKEMITNAYDAGHKDFISGMAVGIDTIFAQAVLIVRDVDHLHIRLIAAVPFAGQESRWPENSKILYRTILDMADQVQIVSPGAYSPAKMQIRNVWMVDNSHHVMAGWNGQQSGGTWNCLQYATQMGRTITQLNPTTLEVARIR